MLEEAELHPLLSEPSFVRFTLARKQGTTHSTDSNDFPYHKSYSMFEVVRKHGAGIVQLEIISRVSGAVLLKYTNSKIQ